MNKVDWWESWLMRNESWWILISLWIDFWSQMDWCTDGQTMLVVKSLSQLKRNYALKLWSLCSSFYPKYQANSQFLPNIFDFFQAEHLFININKPKMAYSCNLWLMRKLIDEKWILMSLWIDKSLNWF